MIYQLPRRRPILWIGLPLLLGLLGYLGYTQPGIWIQFFGSAERKALHLIEDLGGQYKRRGDDAAAPVVIVDLGRTKVTGRDLVQLRGLPELESLHLGLDDLRDENLDGLAGLSCLRTLSWRARFSDTTLGSLKAVSQLRVLFLGMTPLQDEQLRHLQPLTELEQLDLAFTAVSGPGFQHLQSLPKLRVLSLRGCVLEQGLVILGEFPALEEVDMTKAALRPMALKQLKALRNLRVLKLSAPTPQLAQWVRSQLSDAPRLNLVFEHEQLD
jgi:hypothetical protein